MVKRLVASLDAEAKAEVKAVEEEDAEAGPPAAAADPGDPEAATRVLRDSRKRSVVESLSSAPRLARERDGENLSDEDEDVFATAPPSPMGSVASANGGSAGNEKNENENVPAPALAAALAARARPPRALRRRRTLWRRASWGVGMQPAERTARRAGTRWRA